VFELLDFRFLLFRIFGANALVIFMLHGLALILPLKIVAQDSQAPVVLLVLASVLGVCYAAAAIPYRRRIFIRL
jgi:hypothetical protein